jgi:hypothetical protein
MAWSSRWSPDPVRFVVGGRCSILSRVAVASTTAVVWCLALVHVDAGMWRRFSSSTMSSEDDVVGIW